MKRREILSTLTTASAVLGALAVWPHAAHAQAKKPVAGTDYMVLETRAPVEAPAGKIEVVEFFWYNCPHCSAFEPVLAEWAKKLPKDVAFRRVPRRFGDNEAAQQQLYYALEAMGLVEKLHAKVFKAIHTEKQRLTTATEISDWIATQGVDKAKFLSQFNSFSVVSKASKAAKLQTSYNIEGVPALGVAGRYWTDGQLAGNNERALQVVNALVADIRAGH